MAPERDVRMMDREEGKEFRLRAYVTEMMEVQKKNRDNECVRANEEEQAQRERGEDRADRARSRASASTYVKSCI